MIFIGAAIHCPSEQIGRSFDEGAILWYRSRVLARMPNLAMKFRRIRVRNRLLQTVRAPLADQLCFTTVWH